MTSKADTLRREAVEADRAAQESFDRCDTDGFLSQWASGMTAQLKREQARLADAGGTDEFPALFDLDGELVAAKLICTRYGMAWGLLDSDDPQGKITGWLTAFPKLRQTLERNGYREGTVRAGAYAKTWAPSSATGLSGVTQVTVRVFRTDGGFSRDVQIVSDGRQ